MVEYIPASALSFMDYEHDEEDTNSYRDCSFNSIFIDDSMEIDESSEKFIPELIDNFINSALLIGLKKVEIFTRTKRRLFKILIRHTLATNPYVREYHDLYWQTGTFSATLAEF
ncbi:MAG: hypothetical protein GXO75_10860 [Calditrichaeota bacterium]|nr:hypothetical protein [Calditrichota bacterium]